VTRPREELAQRDDTGDTGHRQRQFVPADRFKALPHHEAKIAAPPLQPHGAGPSVAPLDHVVEEAEW
jgi:hypothetical protein